jgi:hypothetical protein
MKKPTPLTEKSFSYDLYNTETEQVEATERHTPADVKERNFVLANNREPKRWLPTPWVND